MTEPDNDNLYDDDFDEDDWEAGPPAPEIQKDSVPKAPKDEFRKYSGDPRLKAELPQVPQERAKPDDFAELTNILAQAIDEQDIYDGLRLFKRRKVKIIESLENDPLKNRELILSALSEVAECILLAAYNISAKVIAEKFGLPGYMTSYKQFSPAHLGVVSMGKQGAKEINYESDLDLIFIYSHIGETHGPMNMSNGEYFAKLAQRLMSLLSIPTGAGKCYDIDTELRPSGNAGTLVVSYDHFLNHQMNTAASWERLALLRARPCAGNETFLSILDQQISQLNYHRPLSPNFFSDMHTIRQRVIDEKVREKPDRLDIKIGPGGIMDIEFLLQGLLLKNAAIFPNLRQKNTFALLRSLRTHRLLPETDAQVVERAYILYRSLESHIQLLKKRSETHFDHSDAGQIAECLLFSSESQLWNELIDLRKNVRHMTLRLYAPDLRA
jgi:glutamate-ammonia-ligase adenylyltransferase